MIKNLWPSKYWLLVAIILVAHLAVSYWGVVKFDYPIAPGDDISAHLSLIDSLRQTPKLWPSEGYPPGFHYLVIFLSGLTGLRDATVMSWLWPMLLVLSGLSLLIFATKAFSRQVGLLSYALFVLLATQPYQTAADGGLPNILATGILIPLGLACWIGLWRGENRARNAVGFGLVSLLILWTHHLSTLSWLTIIVITGLGLVIWRCWHALPKVRLKLIVTTLAILGLMLLIFTQTEFFGAARRLFNVSIQGASSPAWNLGVYSTAFSGLVFQFSFVGALILIGAKKLRAKFGAEAAIVAVIWFVLYYIGSRSSLIIEPGRLARDLVFPSSILASIGILASYRYLTRLSVPLLPRIFLLALIIAAVPAAWAKWSYLTGYEPMVRFSTADQSLLNFVRNSSQRIAIAPKTDYWDYFAANEILSGKIKLTTPNHIPDVLIDDSPSCLAVSTYSGNVWPNSLKSTDDYDQVRADLHWQQVTTMADPNKTWYLFCRR